MDRKQKTVKDADALFGRIVELWNELQGAVIGGDMLAWDRFITQPYNALQCYADNYCYRTFGDDSFAPEVVGRFFKRLLTQAKKGKPATIGFLKRALHWAASEIYRKECRRQNRQQVLDDGLGVEIDETLVEKLIVDEFWEWASAHLTERERQVLVGHLEGKSGRQVCEELSLHHTEHARILRSVIERCKQILAD